MNRGFEVQLLESLSNVNRRRSQWKACPISTLNLAILMLGFISIAVAYTLNKIPLDTVVASFGPRAAIEGPRGTDSAAKALMKLPRDLARFMAG
jgi:hypothetical protein